MEIHPATPDRWGHVVTLFGANGAYSNCWCTWWILTGKEFSAALPEDRRQILADLVDSGEEPGLIAYQDGRPVGWCAVGPRSRYTRMMSTRSRVYGPVGTTKANWVVNCFFIHRRERGQGIASRLLEAAIAYAQAHGADSIDGYPLIDTTHGAAALYVGSLSMFESAGFVEVARVNNRPLMRRDL